jgi:hypothetical protein
MFPCLCFSLFMLLVYNFGNFCGHFCFIFYFGRSDSLTSLLNGNLRASEYNDTMTRRYFVCHNLEKSCEASLVQRI